MWPTTCPRTVRLATERLDIWPHTSCITNSIRAGVSYSTGIWRECTWARFPGHDLCTQISVKCAPRVATAASGVRLTPLFFRHAWAWERTVQACSILFIVLQLIAAVLFSTSLRDPTAHNTAATAASSISLVAGILGLIATSVFISRTPGKTQAPHLTEFTW